MTDTMIRSVRSCGDYRVIRRNGAVVAFEPHKISTAMTKAFMAVAGPTIKKILESPRLSWRPVSVSQAGIASLLNCL